MKKRQRCLFCHNLETKRIGKIYRQKRDPVQRFLCKGCKKSFTLGLEPHARVTQTQKVEITRSHLEGRTPIRQIIRDTKHSSITVVKAIQEVTAHCVSTAWIAQNLRPQWNGYLAVDGTAIEVWDWSAKHFHYTKEQKRFLHKLIWLVGLDLATLDLPHHHLGEEESMIDLVLFFQQLKANGYPLKGIVSDGNPDIPRAAKKVYGNIFVHQTCVRHFLQSLRYKLKKETLSPEYYDRYLQAIYQERWIPGLPKNLFTYQTTPELPKTNQQIENLFKQENLRLHSINQFHSFQTAENYLNAWSLYRRFTPFTDCKGNHKQFNGQSPLMLAGCNIKGLDFLQLIDTLI
jgi:transposase-like protein